MNTFANTNDMTATILNDLSELWAVMDVDDLRIVTRAFDDISGAIARTRSATTVNAAGFVAPDVPGFTQVATYRGEELGPDFAHQTGYAMRRDGIQTSVYWVSNRLLSNDPDVLDRQVLPALRRQLDEQEAR